MLQQIAASGGELPIIVTAAGNDSRRNPAAGCTWGPQPAIYASPMAIAAPRSDALAAMGVAVWPMFELEADDGLASAAAITARDQTVEKICIWTLDKDLAQCVVGDRVVQVDRKTQQMRDAAGVRRSMKVAPLI